MACISKLSAGFAYDCDTGATGIENALLINKSDISSYAVSSVDMVVTSLALNSGTKPYRIDTPKRTLVVTESLKINEGAPNAFSYSATLTITSLVSSPFMTYILNPLTNGNFLLLTKARTSTGSYAYRVYGMYYGLSSSSIDRSSADNGGWTTVTLQTPDQVIGEDGLLISSALYESLFASASY